MGVRLKKVVNFLKKPAPLLFLLSFVLYLAAFYAMRIVNLWIGVAIMLAASITMAWAFNRKTVKK